MEKKLKFEILPFEFTTNDFNDSESLKETSGLKKDENGNYVKFDKDGNEINLDIDTSGSALYSTNAEEYFREAMIGENSTRANFRQVLGVKDRVKLGRAVFNSLIKSGACDFVGGDSTASQKTFEVCPLMINTQVCMSDLENGFMSDQIAKGSNKTDDAFSFMNYFYETLALSASEEMEYLTWRGDTGTTFSAPLDYLETCDGLEVKLTADTDVIKPTSGNGGIASAVTSTNIIDKLIQARNVLPAGVKNKQDFVFMLSTNAYEAYIDAISENKASGQYFVESIVPNFQGVQVFKAEGASDDTIVAGNWSNFLNIQDLVSDETGFQVVDFYRTTLDRKIGVRTDFKFQPDYILGEEIYAHIV